MPNLHDIERRINSVASTKQITRTMEMVAAAKIRRATERVNDALPWAMAVSDMLINAAKHAPMDSEPLLQVHDEVKRALVVVVTSDRGLAGGFNSNVLRHAEKLIREKERQGVEVEVVACGKKALGYFSYRNIKPVMEFQGLSADPTYEEAAQIGRLACTMSEREVLPVNQQSYADLLGLKPKEEDVFASFREKDDTIPPGDLDFEPDAESVMRYLMQAYLRNAFYFALLDSAAGEQGARRNAMKSATDNANEMVSTLTRVYNRVRQGAITTEITEIVGGAAALEE